MARTLQPVRIALGIAAPFLFVGLLVAVGMASVRPV